MSQLWDFFFFDGFPKTEYYSDISKKCRVIPREDCVDDPDENWFHVSEICHDSVDNFCLIHFYLDNLLNISRSVSRAIPEFVFGKDPHEDVPGYCKDEPRNDCSAILSNGCITALLSESSTGVDTYPCKQLVSRGENKGFLLKEIQTYQASSLSA